MAVDLPVPVVPINLKCFASSTGGIPTPATVSHPERPLLRCARTINTPRLCTSRPCRCPAPLTNRTQSATASVRTAVIATALTESIPFDHEIVALLAKGRRFAIHANAQPLRLTAAPPIDPSALLLELAQVRAQLIAPRAKGADFGGGRQRPARDAD